MDRINKTTANGRFHASGGVCPQKHLYEFASVSPARIFVNPRLREAAGTLAAMQENVSKISQNKKHKINEL